MKKSAIGAFIPFYERFPEIARRETKIITISSDNSKVPAGKYWLAESFCTDDKCDCRKVMINVIPVNKPKVLATVGFGWESIKYYEKWMYGDIEIAKQMAGTYLELGGFQSENSEEFLKIINISLDKDFIDLIKKHYGIWKKIKLK